MLRLHSIRQITWQHPSQWYARTDDGRPVYIRYKSGELAVRVGPVGGADDDAVGGETAIEMEHGHRHDSQIDLDEMLKVTGMEVADGNGG